MSKHRYTIEVLASGQPRPYADTVYRCRITFEWQGMEGFSNKNAPFVIQDTDNEETAHYHAQHFSGWTEKGEGDWASTRLSYIKKVAPGVWEWETNSPYTD